jgi:uncharacterized protein (DUF305 family)
MKRLIFCAATLCTLVLGQGSALAQASEGSQAGHGSSHTHEMAGASRHYMDAMDRMKAEMDAMDMSGMAGVDFALMMIPHHQSAIDMAKAYLDSGDGDAELTKLSQEIVAAQEREIAFLKDWLARNGR